MHNSLLHTDPISQAIDELVNINNRLVQQNDLSPNNPIVNHQLTHLVDTLFKWSAQKTMNPLLRHDDVVGLLSTLPSICGAAECEMEKWWSQKLIASEGCIWEAINTFWYISQYQSLTAAEVELIQNKQANEIVFLGCGALPLTALILSETARNEPLHITCVDSDPLACSLAADLIKRCQLEHCIQVVEACATQFTPAKNDIVICASLLKTQGLYQHLHDCEVQNIVVRDVEGVFRFLYSMAPYPSPKLYQEADQTTADPSRINISRLFQLQGSL